MNRRERPCGPGSSGVQRIVVFQQRGSGENKIRGLWKYAPAGISLDVQSIDEPLPPVLDQTDGILPDDWDADLVLDYLPHPDLSRDLILRCVQRGIAVVASGKKFQVKGAWTPPV